MQRKVFWTVFIALGLLADFTLPLLWGILATIPIGIVSWWITRKRAVPSGFQPSPWTRSRGQSPEFAGEPGDDDFAEYDGVRPNLDLAAQVPAPGIDPCFLRYIAAREQQVGV